MRIPASSLPVVLLVLLAATAPAAQAQAEPGAPPDRVDTAQQDPVAIATRLLDRMDAGDYAGAAMDFTPQMKAALCADKLAAVQQQLAAAGPVQRRDPAKRTQQSGITVVTVRIHRASAAIDATVAIDATIAIDGDGKVAGLHYAPAPPPAAPPGANANFIERDFSVGTGARALPGTLAMPKSDTPARVPGVVLVHGSGPHDRDETIGPNRPFRDIARGLAAAGIASLRYDKRTQARPQDYADGAVTVDTETTDDAVAAVAALQRAPGVDPGRVFVLGHSQGALLAPRIAQRADGVAGLVLLAAPARPLLDILIEQHRRLAAMDGTVDAAEQQAIDTLVQQVAQVRDGDAAAGAPTPLGQPAGYWRSIEAIDPVADARALSQPVLLLQGGRDIQVVDADWQRWRAAFTDDARFTLRHYPALNHLGIAGRGPGTLAEYQTAGQVDTALIADIAGWINARGDAQQ